MKFAYFVNILCTVFGQGNFAGAFSFLLKSQNNQYFHHDFFILSENGEKFVKIPNFFQNVIFRKCELV